jgi:phosphate transport system substrate-binding protein
MVGAASAVIVPSAMASYTVDSISSAGSTLFAPLAETWSTAYLAAEENGVPSGTVFNIEYSPTGSGTGLTDSANGTNDFDDSDLSIGEEGKTISSWAHPVLQFPWALTATAIAYNLPGIGSGLKLSPAVITDLLSGKITNWDSSEIQKLNTKKETKTKTVTKTVTKRVHGKRKRVKEKVKVKYTVTVDSPKLPNHAVSVFHRSDGSGDSYVIESLEQQGAASTYTADGGPATLSATWPFTAGTGEAGNAGIELALAENQYSISYVAVPYIWGEVQNGPVEAAAVENSAGKFVLPSLPAISAEADAATPATIPAQDTSNDTEDQNFAVNIVWGPKSATTAYPASTYTYGLIPASGATDQAALQAFVEWATNPLLGGDLGENDGYAALPSGMSTYVENLASKVTS